MKAKVDNEKEKSLSQECKFPNDGLLTFRFIPRNFWNKDLYIYLSRLTNEVEEISLHCIDTLMVELLALFIAPIHMLVRRVWQLTCARNSSCSIETARDRHVCSPQFFTL